MGRLLFNEDGETLDEIVFDGFVHLEQLNDGLFSLGVGDSYFDIRATKKGKLEVTIYEEGPLDFPVRQRHRTAAECEGVDFSNPDNAYIDLEIMYE